MSITIELVIIVVPQFLINFFPKFPSAPKHVRNSQISSDIISSEICCSPILVKHPRSHAGFRGQKHGEGASKRPCVSAHGYISIQ